MKNIDGLTEQKRKYFAYQNLKSMKQWIDSWSQFSQ